MAEYLITEPPQRCPTHPGELLREIIEERIGLSISETARRIGISRQTLHAILAGTAPLTPESALRLSKLVGVKPGLWLNMQQAYDLWTASRRLADEIDKIETVAAA